MDFKFHGRGHVRKIYVLFAATSVMVKLSARYTEFITQYHRPFHTIGYPEGKYFPSDILQSFALADVFSSIRTVLFLNVLQARFIMLRHLLATITLCFYYSCNAGVSKLLKSFVTCSLNYSKMEERTCRKHNIWILRQSIDKYVHKLHSRLIFIRENVGKICKFLLVMS